MSKSNISFTAWVVIRCMVAMRQSRRWSHLVSEEAGNFYAYCLGYCGKYSPFFAAHRFIPPIITASITEILYAHGIAKHFALRKNAIMSYIETAAARGAKQFVFLGGGFDLGGFNAARNYADANVFEIDMPGMQRHKMQVLRDVFNVIPENFIGVSAHLSKDKMEDILREHSRFDSSQPTVFIAEGLSMYLTQSDFIELLAQIKRLSPTGADFIFTALRDQSKIKQGTRQKFTNHVLQSVGESVSFSMNPANMPEFLMQHGYKQESLVSFAELQRPYRSEGELKRLDKQNGEYIVHARMV